MLLLKSTDTAIEIVTSSGADIDVYAAWVDLELVDINNVIPDCDSTKIASATTTAVVGPPAAGFVRNIKSLYIANADPTDPCDVTIQRDDGTDTVQIEKVPLLAGERISIREGVGMRVIDANGSEKLQQNPLIMVKQSVADHPNSTTTATEVTDLSMPVSIGTWIFEYWLRFRSATSTVGPKLSVNHDGTVTVFLQTLQYLSGLTADSTGVIDQDAVVPQVVAGMAKRAKDATGTLIGTTGVDTINVDTLIMISGLAVVTAAGNIELWHGSETATSTTIMQNSSLRLTKIA